MTIIHLRFLAAVSQARRELEIQKKIDFDCRSSRCVLQWPPWWIRWRSSRHFEAIAFSVAFSIENSSLKVSQTATAGGLLLCHTICMRNCKSDRRIIWSISKFKRLFFNLNIQIEQAFSLAKGALWLWVLLTSLSVKFTGRILVNNQSATGKWLVNDYQAIDFNRAPEFIWIRRIQFRTKTCLAKWCISPNW